MEKKIQTGNLMNVLTYVADQAMALTKENSVLGERIEQDGVTVIPVSKLTVGFAGGGADVADHGRKKERYPAGGGANVTMTPMSFLVISEGEVQSISIKAPSNASKSEIIDTVIKTVKGFIKKKKEQ